MNSLEAADAGQVVIGLFPFAIVRCWGLVKLAVICDPTCLTRLPVVWLPVLCTLSGSEHVV